MKSHDCHVTHALKLKSHILKKSIMGSFDHNGLFHLITKGSDQYEDIVLSVAIRQVVVLSL